MCAFVCVQVSVCVHVSLCVHVCMGLCACECASKHVCMHGMHAGVRVLIKLK